MLLICIVACDGGGGTGNRFGSGSPGSGTVTTFLVASDFSAGNVPVLGINNSTGVLTPVSGSPVPAGSGPFAVAVAPNGHFVYVANQNSNTVSAFTMATTGILTHVSTVPAGTQPNAIVVDPTGRFVAVTNQSSQSVSIFLINLTTAALTPVASTVTPLTPSDVVFSGQFMYVQLFNSIAGFKVDNTTGALTQMVGSPFTFGNLFNNLHRLAVSPNGRFLYAADSGVGQIFSFTLDAVTGIPTHIGTGVAAGIDPVAMAFDSGNHLFVADDAGNAIVVLNANSANGVLAPNTTTTVTTPVALAFDSTNTFLLAANSTNRITAYSVNTTTGVLTLTSGTPTTVGTAPNSLAVAKP